MRWFAPFVLVGCTGAEISGPPSLVVGTGQFDFETVDEGQELPIVSGPQGGFHVFFGVQARNLDPRNLRLDSQLYDAELPEDTGTPVERGNAVGEEFFFFVRLFEDDNEDGLFKTAGLIHQVERSQVNNRRLELEVIATDRDDRTTEASMIIVPVRQ